MWIFRCMSSRLISAEPQDSLEKAFQLMQESQIRHLPVLEKGRLVGMITDQDLRQISSFLGDNHRNLPQEHLLRLKQVSDVMRPALATANVYDTLEEAALRMVEYQVDALPVRGQDGRVVAMLTAKDCLRGFLTLTGASTGGVQFALEVPDEPGAVTKAANIIRRYGGMTVSILTSYDAAEPGRRVAYLRMRQVDRAELERLKQDLAAVGRLLFVLDSRHHTKEVLADLD